MKKILVTLMVLSGFYFSQAQEIDNPRAILYDNTWYATAVVIDGDTIAYPYYEDFGYSRLNASGSEDPDGGWADISIELCSPYSLGIEFSDETSFSVGGDITGFPTNYCDWDYGQDWWNDINTFNGYYTYNFWEVNNYEEIFYTFSISEIDDNYSMIIYKEDGDEAHFGNSPEMSIVKNKKSKMTIYPNPAKGYIRIDKLTQPSTLIIYNFEGKEMIKEEISTPDQKIDLSRLPSGIYFFQIAEEGQGNSQTGKLIIQ